MNNKIIKSLLIGLSSALGITSCASATNNPADNNNKKIEMNTERKKLVVFFSHTGENYNVGHIEKGNTHIIADMIADATGADRYEIVPEKEYPENYDECIDIAKKELQQNARVESTSKCKISQAN